jgi:adenosylcobinamide-phosphate synthase
MSLSAHACRLAGLTLGFLADATWGDPRRFHPVAGFGQLAAAVEARSYADRRGAGVRHVGVLVGGTYGAGLLLKRATQRLWLLDLLGTAAATWAVLGGRSLRREATAVRTQLAAGDLPAARLRLQSLVGRETAELSTEEVTRAVVESVAENTADAVVAPLFWGAVAGVPGLLGYRAVNTLDAMIGHRSPRYLRFGWAAARLDDAANWLPARVAGLLTMATAPLVVGSPTDAWWAWRCDGRQHPSPNAGVVEAAFAGALGVRLGGRNVYEGRIENRGVLGHGRPVEVGDIARACRLSRLVSVGALASVIALRLVRRPACSALGLK